MKFLIGLLTLAGLFPNASLAQQLPDDDVERLPTTEAQESQEPQGESPTQNIDNNKPVPRSGGSGAVSSRISLESVGLFIQQGGQGASTPISAKSGRLSLDAMVQGKLFGLFDATLSSKPDFNFDEQATSINNNLRELSLGWQVDGQNYLQAGRVNVRRGSALGFSPTDFLRTGSAVQTASPDPTVVRAGRLGTFQASVKHQFSSGAVSALFVPSLASRVNDHDPFDLSIARTNFRDRLLAALDLTRAPGSPQIQVYHDGRNVIFGLGASASAGTSTVLYGEVAVGKLPSLAAESALRYDSKLRMQMAIGASWSNAKAGATFNLEYHRNDAGLTSAQLKQTILDGRGPALQAIAATRQDPISRSQYFARIQFANRFTQGLDLSAFAFIDPKFASALASASAAYDISDNWSVGLFFTRIVGGPQTAYGASPIRQTVAFQLLRYF